MDVILRLSVDARVQREEILAAMKAAMRNAKMLARDTEPDPDPCVYVPVPDNDAPDRDRDAWIARFLKQAREEKSRHIFRAMRFELPADPWRSSI